MSDKIIKYLPTTDDQNVKTEENCVNEKKSKGVLSNFLNTNSSDLTENEFVNEQLCLFQTFNLNVKDDRENASNSVEFWDSAPRYSISQNEMNKMRDSRGGLDDLTINFLYRQINSQVIIRPAPITEKIKGVEKKIFYYPSANEEIIEEVLRKMASIQNAGFHEPNKRTGVVFTVHQLKQELQRCGHNRSYTQIVKSLNILSLSFIDIICDDDNLKLTGRSPYFPSMKSVSRAHLKNDSNAKWYVEFHRLITNSISDISYRQFNFIQLMKHNTQLARWLHKLLINKYTFASKLHTFEIRFSTIKRDSAMLNNYSRERKAIEACEYSIGELVTQNILTKIPNDKDGDRYVDRGPREKILDVIYTLTPTNNFISEVKATNARQGQGKIKLGKKSK